MGSRTIAVFLDGYEESLERRFAADGWQPHLARLREESARFLLDHGPAQRTGLAGEHISTGKSPEAAGRWSALALDPQAYTLRQEGACDTPFPTQLTARTVVFDMPYFDLHRAPNVRGIVGWGAHDPGVEVTAQPAQLLGELTDRFGPYPANDFIYGVVWASPVRTTEMGTELARACDTRTEAVLWLLGERVRDWDLAMVAVSEPHSAIEGLWHGADPAHPLHRLPSAGPALDGLRAVYRAVDRLIGSLAERFPDANLVVFSTGGMGANRSDVASMVLLPELTYRHAFGRPLFQPPAEWSVNDPTGPVLAEHASWSQEVLRHFPLPWDRHRLRRLAKERLPPSMRRVALRLIALGESLDASAALPAAGLKWMPATRYQCFWPRMPFFALPSYYDGRIRVNVAGRERLGTVRAADYEATLDEIEQLVRACRDPISGEEAVDYVERPRERDPFNIGATESDLVVVWKGVHCVLDHPTLGRLGPVPFRRPGGHTGPHGLAYLRAAGVRPGDYGVRSSFDVVPTLCGLLGEDVPAGLSGQSLLDSLARGTLSATPQQLEPVLT
jgi:predicted AlkP superfamily phosphohydrolase/phosphomutase